MRNSTVDQPGMEEILFKKRQEVGSNHYQRMVPPGQDSTEVPCHLGKKIRLENEQLDNQYDLPLRTHRPIPANIRTDKLTIVGDITTPP